MRPNTRPLIHIPLNGIVLFSRRGYITSRFPILINASFSQLGFEIIGFGLGLLLLLFLDAGVKFASFASSGFVATICGFVFGFLGFLLFAQALEEVGDFVDGGVGFWLGVFWR